MEDNNNLAKYRSKRDPRKTPEPFTSHDVEKDKLVFVIQKHHATAVHYDFRLEVTQLMPSWAIPKGPSLDPKVKRLALMTEDHPLDYRHFEGVIPQGQYGAGPVMIWDYGTYWPEVAVTRKERRLITDKVEAGKIMKAAIKNGEIKFTVFGKKIKGSFALVKTRGFGGRPNAWLLIKHKDKYIKEGYDAANYDFSAKTKRNLDQIKARG